MFTVDSELPFQCSPMVRMEIVLMDGTSFHCYHTYERVRQKEGFVIATTREVEDPTNEYDTLEDVPEEILRRMDYIPEFYSVRIGCKPVIVDYSGTLLIPHCYKERLIGLNGEYRIKRVHIY
ncbi:MAG: hypothetical protein MJZ54_00010 [Bacteroidaceae bacterium]|nr:hypothetical protein [Bacteroidaceae bacterium]